MRRITTCLISVLLTYLICAFAGVNRWMFMWLKAFYPGYALCFWPTLLIIVVIGRKNAQRAVIPALLAGLVWGYLSGIVAYELGPAITDGSLSRASSSIRSFGLLTYLCVSLAYPLLILSWLVGITEVLVLRTLAVRSRQNVYGGVVGIVILSITGWLYFLSHQVTPAKW